MDEMKQHTDALKYQLLAKSDREISRFERHAPEPISLWIAANVTIDSLCTNNSISNTIPNAVEQTIAEKSAIYSHQYHMPTMLPLIHKCVHATFRAPEVKCEIKIFETNCLILKEMELKFGLTHGMVMECKSAMKYDTLSTVSCSRAHRWMAPK